MQRMEKVIVRYAPSPTGIPHIGNIRTALYNFLLAKKENGKFILRIEDTDRKRFVPESVQAIEDSLGVLGLNWDEVYRQSERLSIYQRDLELLAKKGLAYEDSGAWRFKVEKGKNLKWSDLVHGQIEFTADVIEDFIIVKSDGYPTYHFASVVDDHDLKISHVLRGDEWISSTPKHLLLYQAFGWNPPHFIHVPAILGPDKKKLSKREGARSVLEYVEDGYLPEALVNFLALLGWSPKGDRELFTLNELIAEFSIERLNKNSPIFNLEKLNWFNRKYLQQLSIEGLVSQIKTFYSSRERSESRSPSTSSSLSNLGVEDLSSRPNGSRQSRTITDQKLSKILTLIRDRMTTLADFDKYSGIFFEKGKQNSPAKEKTRQVKEAVQKIGKWDEKTIENSLEKYIRENNLNPSDFKNTLRLAVFADNTPPIYQSLAVLEKDEVISRIDEAIK